MSENERKFQFENSDYLLSLSKIAGQKIKDINGYVSFEFGDPVFMMCNIILEDGSSLNCGGEHDLPYATGKINTVFKQNIESFEDED